MKYLYLDTETGGVNPTTDALLTIGLVAHEDARGILGTEHILVQPEGRAVHVKALAVNHINIEEHQKTALSREDAAVAVKRFCELHFGVGFKNAPYLVGHNIGFDRSFVDPLFTENHMRIPYSYRNLDTMGIALFLQDCGYFTLDNMKLDSLVEHFNCEIAEKDRHTALGDALVTRDVHLAMRELAQQSGLGL